MKFAFRIFEEDGTRRASLSFLHQLFDSEKDCVVEKALELTDVAPHPSNVERQTVKLALEIFDEENIPALENFGSQSDANVAGTVKFVQKIGSLWKFFQRQIY